ncbi:MAG: DNA adenine methylase [Chloroflexaceae bacterium]|nr:DNA adenine methylase [Chloroflexaceae bacterium]
MTKPRRQGPLAPTHRPIGRYFGGKWKQRKRLVEICDNIPHCCYVEPFGGFYSLGLAKARAFREVYNDLHPGNRNLMTVLRDIGGDLVNDLERSPITREEFERCKDWELHCLTPLEQARRYLLHAQCAFSGGGGRWSSGTSQARLELVANQSWGYLLAHWERMEGVIITGEDALDCLDSWDAPGTLFYLDPPYPWATRNSKDNRHANLAAAMPRRQYRHDYTDAQHQELLEKLCGLEGSVILSGYDCPMYSQALKDWERHERPSRDSSRSDRLEVVWVKQAKVSTVVETTVLRGSCRDALGRGRGDGRRGGVRTVVLRRKRKNGEIWTGEQCQLQWEADGRKHSRYLRKAIAPKVRADWEAGATVKELLEKYRLLEPKHA